MFYQVRDGPQVGEIGEVVSQDGSFVSLRFFGSVVQSFHVNQLEAPDAANRSANPEGVDPRSSLEAPHYAGA